MYIPSLLSFVFSLTLASSWMTVADARRFGGSAAAPPGSVAAEYDGETSNYGNVKKAAQHIKEQIEDKVLNNNPDTKAGGSSSDGTKKKGAVDDEPFERESFIFFSIHDYNKDGHLDGNELLLAFNGYEFVDGVERSDSVPLDDLEGMVDHALHEDDKDNDGRISWAEFLESQAYHHQLNTNGKS